MNTSSTSSNTKLAFAGGVFAYLVWGVVGLYFKLVTTYVGPFTLLANRVIWSLAFVIIVLACRRQLGELWTTLRTPRLVGALLVSSILIGFNWMVFIYAAHTGRLVQASLGYFLTPLLNVLLGVVLLKEHLRRGQLIAVLVACVGVGIISYLKLGSIWIPIGLMLSFSLYGLMRKQIVVGPIVGLGVETALLAPFALAFIAFDPGSRPTGIVPIAHVLMISAGVITAIPLLLFAHAARRLRLITIGLLQYISPSVQFLVAFFVAKEHVSTLELIAFVIIWAGLIVFSIDSYAGYRSKSQSLPIAPAAFPTSAIAVPLQSRA